LIDDEGTEEAVGQATMYALQELQIDGWHLHDDAVLPHPDLKDGVIVRLESENAIAAIPVDIQKVVERTGYLSPRELTNEIKRVIQEFNIS